MLLDVVWAVQTGRTATCVVNIRNAVNAALAHHGLGVLLTDWGDYGHTQPFSISYPGILAAAGFSWNNEPPVCGHEVEDASYECAKPGQGSWPICAPPPLSL
jgi:hypothetical protein